MNGRLFARLNRLKQVWLDGNVCIEEKFESETRIATMAQVVDAKCAFTETLHDMSVIFNKKFKIMENFMETTLAEKDKLQNEVSAAKATIAQVEAQKQALTAELKAAQSAKAQPEAKTKFAQEICEKLDVQHNETCNAKAQELRDNINHKNSENKDLSMENQKQSSEINEKKLKIKQLEDKVKILSESAC